MGANSSIGRRTLYVWLRLETDPDMSSRMFCASVILVPTRLGILAIPTTGVLPAPMLTLWNCQFGFSVPLKPSDELKRASAPVLNACLPLVQLSVSLYVKIGLVCPRLPLPARFGMKFSGNRM